LEIGRLGSYPPSQIKRRRDVIATSSVLKRRRKNRAESRLEKCECVAQSWHLCHCKISISSKSSKIFTLAPPGSKQPRRGKTVASLHATCEQKSRLSLIKADSNGDTKPLPNPVQPKCHACRSKATQEQREKGRHLDSSGRKPWVGKTTWKKP
jgi:hypothetical protein